MEEKILIEEMVKALFAKKWRKRAIYDFISEKRRYDAYFRYHNGEYLNESCIKYIVNGASIEKIYKLLLKEGGTVECFYISCSESGIFKTEEALKKAFTDGMGAMLYAGNGVGYFQGEQCIGAPEKYVLVNQR